MSIAQNPLMGSMKKSMGNFTTSSYNGINTVRSKVFKRKDNKTKAQMDHRMAFKLIVTTYQSLGDLVEWGFAERKINTSAYNSFISANYPSAVDKTGEVPVISYPLLLVSKGSIPAVRVTESTLSSEGITIGYETSIGLPKVSATDEIIAFAKLRKGSLLITRQSRGSEEDGSILIPYQGPDDEVECCYLFARSEDGKKVSNSVNIGLSDL
jgi:hypothetical protein